MVVEENVLESKELTFYSYDDSVKNKHYKDCFQFENNNVLN